MRFCQNFVAFPEYIDFNKKTCQIRTPDSYLHICSSKDLFIKNQSRPVVTLLLVYFDFLWNKSLLENKNENRTSSDFSRVIKRVKTTLIKCTLLPFRKSVKCKKKVFQDLQHLSRDFFDHNLRCPSTS